MDRHARSGKETWQRVGKEDPWGDVKQIGLAKRKGEKLAVRDGRDKDQKSSTPVPLEPWHPFLSSVAIATTRASM